MQKILKQDVALQENVFPFGHWRAFNSWYSVYPFRLKGLNSVFPGGYGTDSLILYSVWLYH